MHYAPGADNDKGGAALLTKLMTITSPPGKDKWADKENLMAVDLRALDPLETSWHNTLNAFLEHVQQLHVQVVRARVYSCGEPDAVPLTNANKWAITLNQIPLQFLTLSSMYGGALTPHPRMLAALRLAYDHGRSVPILKIDMMWNEGDEIETTRFTYEGTGNQLTQSMSGHDKCLTTITVSTIEE